jgi:hypothetical protein
MEYLEILKAILPPAAIVLSSWSLYVAREAKKEVKTQSLFSGFQQANQITIQHPKLLRDVHGLKDLTDEECRSIAYLSILMDAFQHEDKEHDETTFLDKITSIPENKERWKYMKKIYYADFDEDFINRIDKKFDSNLSPGT